jgi:hypothetical protein
LNYQQTVTYVSLPIPKDDDIKVTCITSSTKLPQKV